MQTYTKKISFEAQDFVINQNQLTFIMKVYIYDVEIKMPSFFDTLFMTRKF